MRFVPPMDSWTRHHDDSYAMGYLMGSIYTNILVASILVRYWVFDIPASDEDAINFCIRYVLLPLLIIGFWIWPNEEAYEHMDRRYKEEIFRVLKGWLVFAYVVLSILSPVAVMALLWE